MKLVFILVLTAFTVCLSRKLDRHRHKKKFPQGRETLQRDAYIRPEPGVNIIDFFLNMGQISGILEKSNMDWIE